MKQDDGRTKDCANRNTCDSKPVQPHRSRSEADFFLKIISYQKKPEHKYRYQYPKPEQKPSRPLMARILKEDIHQSDDQVGDRAYPVTGIQVIQLIRKDLIGKITGSTHELVARIRQLSFYGKETAHNLFYANLSLQKRRTQY